MGPDGAHIRITSVPRHVARWAPLGWLIAIFTFQPAMASGAVEHHLSFVQIRQQVVQVESRFPAEASVTELVMPNWNPGAYQIVDFAADILHLEVADGAGRPLPANKVRKNAWAVQPLEAGTIIARYTVHAGDLGVSTSWASEDFVLLNPASVLLYTDESRGLEQRLTLDAAHLPGRAWSTLPELSTGVSWRARGYDELVDSPLVVSANPPVRFRQDGHEYALLNVGDETLWDRERAATDLQSVVAAANGFWGQAPLERPYWFFNFLVERRGGLEHDHGAVLMTSRWQMRDEEDYLKWLGLAAHEYFHLWNVRHLRPASLAPYDYQREQYVRELWLAEGITAYYDNLLLSRAGLAGPNQYLRLLAEELHRLELTPGRGLVSLEQASFDAWIRHYQPDANSLNSTVSYYTKGAVVAFALDARIREESRGRRSLDDVMRAFFETWRGQPYPRGAFEETLGQVAGVEVRSWLEPLLVSSADPDIDEALAFYGLQLDRHPERTAAEAAGVPVPLGLGVNWSLDSDRLLVGSVANGTSGARAGLLPGDELLAIDGERVLRSNYDSRMRRLRAGDSVTLLISRRNRLQTVDLVLEEARPSTYVIRFSEDADQRTLRRLERWLGQELPR